MRVFLDTNVLASAFGTRGLCSDVLRLILDDHELVTGELVIEELRAVLSRKFGVTSATVDEIESLLRDYHVEPRLREIPNLKLSRADSEVVGSALRAGADVLVTGDHQLLTLKPKPPGLRIVSPREFWTLTARRSRG